MWWKSGVSTYKQCKKQGKHTQEFITYMEIHSGIVEKEADQYIIDWSYKSDKEKCVVCAE